MNGWQFTLSRRWLGYLALAVAFAIACTLLALWQFDRREGARAEIERVDANWESAPRPIEDVLPALDAWDDAAKWTPVVLTGHYLAADQLLVRGRPFNGSAGFEVLVPFQLDDGTVVVIDRGWLPSGNQQENPDTVPAPPAGDVTVVARLKPGEPTIPGRSAPAGQVATIHLPTIADLIAQPTYTGAYGLLVAEDPTPSVRPAAFPKPVADEGPHLSYAFQWLVFAIMGFLGLGWAVRQEYRIRNADDPEERKRAAKRERRAAAKTRSDAEIEDAILDRR